jgi:hypothetical protein
MTVWVAHPLRIKNGNMDMTSAEKFGKLEYINRRYVYGDELREFVDPVHDTSSNVIPVQFERNLLDAAFKFDPKGDYLLIAGDHLQLLSLVAMLAQRHGSFSVLRYDRNIDDYVPVRLYSDIAPAGLM